MITMINRSDIKGLKYYLALCAVVLVFYLYSMFTGLRYMSFGEYTHSRDKNTHAHTRGVYYHRTYNHK